MHALMWHLPEHSYRKEALSLHIRQKINIFAIQLSV